MRFTAICTPRAMAEQLGRPYPDPLSDLVLSAVDEVLGDLPTLAESARQFDEILEQRVSNCEPAVAQRMRARPSPPMAPYLRARCRRTALLFGMLSRAREPGRDRSGKRVALVVALVCAWLDPTLARRVGGDLKRLARDEVMFDLLGLTSDVVDGRMGPPTAENAEDALNRARLDVPRLARPGPPWEVDLGEDERYLTLNGGDLTYPKGVESRRFSHASEEGRWLAYLLGGPPFGAARNAVRSHVKAALEGASQRQVSVVAEDGDGPRFNVRVRMGPRLRAYLG